MAPPPSGYFNRVSAFPQKAPIGSRIAQELQRSWWISLTLVPLGFATWAGFLYVGLAYHRRAWQVASAVYAAALATALLFVEIHPKHGGLHAFGGLIVLAVWFGGFAHAMAVRRQLNQPPRPPSDPALAAANARLSERRGAQSLALRNPALALELGVGRPDVPGADPRGVVDINHASAEAIAHTSGVSREVAEEIVAARERVYGFSSVEDMGSLLELHPWDVERLKHFSVCLPR